MDPDVPPITDELRRHALNVPGSWIYSIAPGYDAEGEVPGSAIVGAWQVDQDGQLGDFVPNPGYQPSSVSRPSPSNDPVEQAIQRAATGTGTDGDVISALAGATIYLPVNSEHELIAYAGADADTATVALFTDPSKGPSNVPFLLPSSIEDLLAQLPDDNEIVINPATNVTVVATTGELRRAISAFTEAQQSKPATRSSAEDADIHDAGPGATEPDEGDDVASNTTNGVDTAQD
jgi:hypothetical protein